MIVKYTVLEEIFPSNNLIYIFLIIENIYKGIQVCLLC
jgi:hypothetical protein